ncbi:MAG: hypothetical protein V4558_07630 [Gemmatimonadota bacterium]
MTISRYTPSTAVPRPVNPPTARPAAAPAAPTAARPSAAARAGDSALWNVLTDEERAFFLDMNALGPISYGPGGAKSSTPAAPLGQRIDILA